MAAAVESSRHLDAPCFRQRGLDVAARRSIAACALAFLAMAIVACGGAGTGQVVDDTLRDDAITIGSFNFAESELLAEIYAQALESEGYPVRRAFGIGPREFVAPALAAGLVEFVPEYAGTALEFLSVGATPPTPDVEATHAALVRAAEARGLVALAAAPAQNANAFVVTREIAFEHGLSTISDLADVAGELTFGGPPECPSRPLCLGGLERVYELSFKAFLPLDAGGPITRQALKDRHADVALLFTTDPAITGEGFVLLADDRGLQPAENVTPIIRRELVERLGPAFTELVDAVSRRLTTEVLRDLNAQVAVGTTPAAAVATAWLASQGLG
jgi:osmoprotectant transport system substrate-binding protein